MPAYLEQLTVRLTSGIAKLPETRRLRHARYFLESQRDDGGFGGREGDSDLYYTGFGLRGLAIVGELYGEVAKRAAVFLSARLAGRETIVDFLSLIYGAALLEAAAGEDFFSDAAAAWRDSVAAALESLRRDDGGYAKGPDGMASSTYHTFLVLLCLELIERPVKEPRRIVDFLLSQEADEAGFREIRAQKRASVNPTAAAIASLRILNQLTDDIREDTIEFLLDMLTEEGGFRANTRIPIADLLSTFTGLLTMTDLGGAGRLDKRRLSHFVHSLERPEGGFHGAAWDAAHDVEYSFYGLGCLAILAEEAEGTSDQS